MKLLSIVVPCCNEAANLRELHRRLCDTSRGLELAYEIVFVDDGSQDASPSILRELADADSHVRVVTLARNFGHQAALTAGLEHARGDAVMQLDGDLQHPPELIPHFVARWQEGYEVVYGYRRDVRPRFGYRVINALLEVKIPVESADFRLMDRQVVDALLQMPERARFLRGMIAWLGFRQIGIAYREDERFAGSRAYSLRKRFRLALDGVLAFSFVPLRIAVALGGVTLILGLVYAAYILIRYATGGYDVPGWTGTMMAILILGGVQLLCLGLIAEYIGKIFEEVKRRPLYVVRDRQGFGPAEDSQATPPDGAESPPTSGETKTPHRS